MSKQDTFTISFDPSKDFTSKLNEIAALLQQVPKAVAREVLGDLDRIMLKLGSCDFGPAIHARVGHRVHRFTFSRVDELLASARRANESFSHG